eukprot:scaffold7011_cov112-Isochrysis_galbana.AAC.5
MAAEPVRRSVPRTDGGGGVLGGDGEHLSGWHSPGKLGHLVALDLDVVPQDALYASRLSHPCQGTCSVGAGRLRDCERVCCRVLPLARRLKESLVRG